MQSSLAFAPFPTTVALLVEMSVHGTAMAMAAVGRPAASGPSGETGLAADLPSIHPPHSPLLPVLWSLADTSFARTSRTAPSTSTFAARRKPPTPFCRSALERALRHRCHPRTFNALSRVPAAASQCRKGGLEQDITRVE